MGFYKLTIIVAIVHLIIFLAILGVVMTNSYTEKIYPSQLSSCPDFYTFDGSYCNSNPNIFSFNNTNSCNRINITATEFNVKGTDENSGLCAKKIKAQECKINWDGITNNSDICYK
jgi:hypothetical protein